MSDIYFDPATFGFYNNGLHSQIPLSAQLISAERHTALLAGQAQGKQIVAGLDGMPVLQDISVSLEQMLSVAKNDLRPLRDKILGNLEGIALRAYVHGQQTLVDEVYAEPDGPHRRLLDITDDSALNAATNRDDMDAAVQSYYSSLVASVSPELRLAFKGLDR